MLAWARAHPVVDAHDLFDIVVHDGQRAAHGHGALECVGQVDLVLGRVLLEARQLGAQPGDVEGVDAGVDLVDGEHLGAGLGRLDDGGGAAAVVAHDAPVGGGLGDAGREHGAQRVGGGVGIEQAAQGLRAHERRVAGHDHHGAGRGERGEGGAGGVAGAPWLLLSGEAHIGPRSGCAHGVFLVVHDHDRSEAGVAGGVDDPADHRLAQQWVQHLGQRGLHARAATGSEDDGVGTGRRRCGVGGHGTLGGSGGGAPGHLTPRG